MEPALLGSVDEPDVIVRIDLQPLQDGWEVIWNVAELAFNDRSPFFCALRSGHGRYRDEAANKQGIAKEPLNNSTRARRRLCGGLRLGLDESGLVVPNKRVRLS